MYRQWPSPDFKDLILHAEVRTPRDLEAEIGLTGGTPKHLIYVDGEKDHKIEKAGMVDHLEGLIRKKVAEKEAADKDLIAKES